MEPKSGPGVIGNHNTGLRNRGFTSRGAATRRNALLDMLTS
ncbi:hypothetical protein AS9A_0381 [Hoyosella subflava DQS3-9A1]|uniref:Uncharacterized protein n=1 Tax=Hoyosella subflava (strain DSM 45089 / JCM 17490 / NBRC 109087 / DQS3-9A1) TaxID=443218 RepID=F6EH16_HOYSD|nr:hypothetical protein AS9A_0381 [Hoyosella subflava DQS3-9A1]